jgi:hypothetical protein
VSIREIRGQINAAMKAEIIMFAVIAALLLLRRQRTPKGGRP